MSSIVLTCRIGSRSTAGAVRRKAAFSRGFVKSVTPCAAHPFNLPSLSPTMEEGGISSWKVKEGDSFSAGDVLLEIETDKAQMDVEAQDDGIIFKILEQDGAKGIKVGARIAVLAEPGDDLSSLEIPKEDTSAPAPKASKPEQKEASTPPPRKHEQVPEPSPKQESGSTSSSTSSSALHDGPSSQHYPLYPSVQHLLHIKGISSMESSKIPATGPNGRLLKGDVLSYLSIIEKSYSADQSKRISKLGHIDLSNIKKQATQNATPAAASPAKAAAVAVKEEVETEMEIALPISLAAVFATQKRMQDSLGITLPLSTFIARASEIANESLPQARAVPTADELFNSVLGLDEIHSTRTSRGRYVPMITALSPPPSTLPRRTTSKAADIIDVLAGSIGAGRVRKAVIPGATGGVLGAVGSSNVFSVSVKMGEEKRVRVYLERVKTVLEAEPGRCVL